MRGKRCEVLADFLKSLPISESKPVIVKFKELDEKGIKVKNFQDACYAKKIKTTISIYGIITIKKAV